MILAFSNDYTVTVLDDVRQANTYCEGIDVEAGVYTFTDERGFVLAPRFTTPNHRFRLLGLLPIVKSGAFTLELTRVQRSDLLADVWAGRTAVSINGWNRVKTRRRSSRYFPSPPLEQMRFR